MLEMLYVLADVAVVERDSLCPGHTGGEEVSGACGEKPLTEQLPELPRSWWWQLDLRSCVE